MIFKVLGEGNLREYLQNNAEFTCLVVCMSILVRVHMYACIGRTYTMGQKSLNKILVAWQTNRKQHAQFTLLDAHTKELQVCSPKKLNHMFLLCIVILYWHLHFLQGLLSHPLYKNIALIYMHLLVRKLRTYVGMYTFVCVCVWYFLLICTQTLLLNLGTNRPTDFGIEPCWIHDRAEISPRTFSGT
jgi:hypothetical protein